ncbi:MAG: glycine zipper family protein [Halieaceae bacterium]
MLTRIRLPIVLLLWATTGSAFANVVVDMSQVADYTQYQTDLQQCEGLAVQNQPDAPQRESVAGTAVKGAAVGAAAGAVSGGSGSKAAKKGAGAGVILAAGRNSRERREASANATAQKDQIVKNCMRGRGYNVLN